MAIFSASVRTISRATGRSATAAAAYRSGTILADARSGLTHDYTAKGGVVGSVIVLPAGAAAAFADRSTLWNAAEAAEKRKDARVARELILALPHELDDEGRAATALAMAEWLAARYGVAVELSTAVFRFNNQTFRQDKVARVWRCTARVALYRSRFVGVFYTLQPSMS